MNFYRSPIHFAAISGNLCLFNEMVSLGIDLEDVDNAGITSFICFYKKIKMFNWTPLHYAAEAGRKEIVKVLIASHVELSKLTLSNTSARYWASINHHRDIERLLVKYGALDCDSEYEMIMKKLT